MAWQSRFLSVCVAFLAALATGASAAPLAAASSSRSGAFIAYSPDRDLRNRMLRASEGALGEWEKIHETAAGAAAPIVLNDKTRAAMPKGGAPVVPLIFETEVGLKMQVDLYDEGAMENGVFEEGVFSALALHAMHGMEVPRAGKAFDMPPRWLIDGLAEELRRSREGTPDGVYAALIQGGRPPELDAFFRQKPEILDAASLILYRAQAVSFLRVLKKSENSKKNFAVLLASPSFSRGGVDAVVEAFPSLGSRSALSKAWTLDIARSSMPPRMASLTVERSDRELAGVLKSLKGGQGLPEAARERGGAFLMREFAVRVFNLEFRSHPLFRPVLEEYRNIANELSRNSNARVDARIRGLEETRSQLVERSRKIADYLNWFEVTQIDAPLRAGDEMTPRNRPAPFNNPYALYLDSLETRGW